MLFLTLKMASEGGGKLKQKRPHTAKPYDRPKSFLNRMTDAVRGLWNHTWVAGLLTTQESNEVASRHQDDGDVTTKRSSLNSVYGSLERTPYTAKSNEKRHWQKPRIPLDGEHVSRWESAPSDDGRLTEPTELSELVSPLALPSTSFASGLQPQERIAEPTTRPALGLSYRNIENSFRDEYHQPLCSSQLGDSSRIGGATAPRQFSKLSNIGKLNVDDLPSVSTKEELNNVNSLGGDTHSECSEESVSTSGCSSMIPHPDKNDYRGDVLSLTKPSLENISKELQESLISESTSKKSWRHSSDITDVSRMKQSFLWSESLSSAQKVKPQPVIMGSKPHFKPQLLNCPLWEGKSVLTTSVSNSNKVTYGFGSSYRRQQHLTLNAPYSVASSVRSVKVKPSNSTGLEVMSSTTKRILETLEKMSTPLKDAKKIPTREADPILDSPLSFTYANCKRRPSYAKRCISHTENFETTPKMSSNHGPPVTRLLTPGSVAVTKTYIKFANEIPNSPTFVLSKEEAPPTNAPNSNIASRGGGKMKSLKDGLHYSRKMDDDHEIVEPINLPSVPLPIKTLPVFNIISPKSAVKSSPVANVENKNIVHVHEKQTSDIVKPILEGSNEKNSNTTPTISQRSTDSRDTKMESGFSFSSPIVQQAVSPPVAVISKTPKEVTHFEFSSPISVGENEKSVSTASDDVFKTPVLSTQPKRKLPVVTDTSQGVGKAAAELKCGSVMDVLSKSPELGVRKATTELKSSSVIDVLSKTQTSGFGDKFKPPSGNWECSTCMLSNKPDALKCIACETPKPDKKNSTEAPSKKDNSGNTVSSFSSNGFGDKFKPSSDTWECPTCLLRVNKNLQKCLACDTVKPGKVVNSGSPNISVSTSVNTSKVNFSFSSSSKLQDKFKATPSTWECEICLVENVAKDCKCKSCEAPKPILSIPVTTSAFKFGFTTQTTSSVGTGFTTLSNTTIPTEIAPAKTIFSTSTTPSEIKFGLHNTNTTSLSPAVTGYKFGLSSNDSKSDAVPATSGFKFIKPSVPAFEASASANGDKKLNTNPVSTVEGSHLIENEVLPISSKSESNSSLERTSKEVTKSSEVEIVKTVTELPPASIQKMEPTPISLSGAAPLPTVTAASTASTLPIGGSGIGHSTFSFGTNPTATLSTAVVTTSKSTPVPSSSQIQNEGFAFKFGNPDIPKSNPPTITTAQPSFEFPVTNFNAGSTVQSTSAQGCGGFKFSFGSNTNNKRNSEDDSSIDNSKKRALPSSGDTPVAFGSFSSDVNSPVVTASTGVNVGYPGSSSPFTAGSTVVTTAPIFGALSTTATSKPIVSNTFNFGNSGIVTPAANSSLPTFGGTSQSAAPPSSVFGSPFAQSNPPQNQSTLAFGASSSSTTTSFGGPTNSSLLAFGGQTTDAGLTNNNGVPPAFGTNNPSTASPFAPASNNAVFGISAAPAFGGFGSLQSNAVNPSATPSMSGQNFSGGFNFATPSSFQFGRQPQSDNNGVFTFSGNQSSTPLNTNSGFSFGQSNASQPAAGFNFNPSTQPALDFGSNPFDISAGNRATRPIKRAKRRTQLHTK